MPSTWLASVPVAGGRPRYHRRQPRPLCRRRQSLQAERLRCRRRLPQRTPRRARKKAGTPRGSGASRNTRAASVRCRWMLRARARSCARRTAERAVRQRPRARRPRGAAWRTRATDILPGSPSITSTSANDRNTTAIRMQTCPRSIRGEGSAHRHLRRARQIAVAWTRLAAWTRAAEAGVLDCRGARDAAGRAAYPARPALQLPAVPRFCRCSNGCRKPLRDTVHSPLCSSTCVRVNGVPFLVRGNA